MPTMTTFYWTLEKRDYQHYIYDIVSLSNALEVGKVLQVMSSASLSEIDFAPVGVCLPSNTEDRRRFEMAEKPDTEKVDFSNYRRAGDGLGLGAFLAYYFRGFPTRRAFCVPSPRKNLLDDVQAVKTAGEELQRVIRMALRVSTATVSKTRVIYPNAYRKAFDGLTWF